MRTAADEDSSHLYKILSVSIAQIYLHTGETRPHRWTPSCNILQLCETSKNFQKRPKTSARRIRFPLNAKVEMAFVLEIVQNFQHDRLYSPSLKCFKQNNNA